MKYQGGKATIAKVLVPVIQKLIPKPNAIVEPFMGGGNMTAALGKAYPTTLIHASEIDKSLVLMWQALINGWQPPSSVDRETWQHYKAAPHSAIRGWVGLAASFKGKQWDGFGGFTTSEKQPRNYVQETLKAVNKAVPHMQNVDVMCCDYQDTLVEAGDLVYCDPPYAGTTGYRKETFDHAAFWDWAALTSATAVLLVSEYVAPVGWVSVCDVPKKLSLGARSGLGLPDVIEKLWQYKVEFT